GGVGLGARGGRSKAPAFLGPCLPPLGTDGAVEGPAEGSSPRLHHLGSIPEESRADPAKPERLCFSGGAASGSRLAERPVGLRHLRPAYAALLRDTRQGALRVRSPLRGRH